MKNDKLKFLILNGPNINFLGIREPEIYGHETYNDLIELIKDHAEKRRVSVEFYQSNHEGDLVDAIQKAYFDRLDGIVFNPAAYTHTSVAIADAVKGTGGPHIRYKPQRSLQADKLCRCRCQKDGKGRRIRRISHSSRLFDRACRAER